ncbi:MAG: flagellar filament capping protein FliD, partial [Treponemataceae bacterium]|nr:flagellar filament capping protein FliD [Treponemataceae bacterium]
MPGINIPGVTDKYNTNSTVEKLMQIERIPLTREQKTLDTYKAQQDAWRDINRKMTSLRDSVKTLYSFDNPFNNKLASSTDEYAVTAEATRSAAYESFKIDVIQPAAADRFLSSELDEGTKVPAGTYTYKVADKAVSMRWKGGSLQDFSAALNRRGNGLIQSRVIGAGKGKKTISIESLKTGEESRLVFEDDARTFAETSGMIAKAAPDASKFSIAQTEFLPAPPTESSGQERLPAISQNGLKVEGGTAIVPPRAGFELRIPDAVKETPGARIHFTVSGSSAGEDVAEALNRQSVRPEFPDPGSATFQDITIRNAPFDAALPAQEPDAPQEPMEKVRTDLVLTAALADGSEMPIPTPGLSDGREIGIDLNLEDYPGIQSIVMRNWNTGMELAVSELSASNPNENQGFVPKHPISTASDAIIKYEGITIRRPENTIDDVVPEVTLNIHEKTERPATISIEPDTEAAKEALITFVGKYNQAVSEINILSQNKQELVDELDYLSADERNAAMEKLGMFLGDTSLTSLKSGLQA